MNPDLSIRLLGSIHIQRGETAVSGFVSRKAEALFLYLACQPQPVAREILADLFWPNHDRSRALANLSVALSNLRQHLATYLLADRYTVGFNHQTDYWLDTAAFEAALTTERIRESDSISRVTATRLETAVSLYQGEFMAGFHLRDTPDFEAWQRLEQERLHQLALTALADLTRFYQERQLLTPAMTHARQLVQIDPLREASHRLLMQLYAAAGQRGDALNQYKQCCQILADELDVPPEAETTALYQAIVQKQTTPTTAVTGQRPLAATASRRKHNLPAAATGFVGREAELQRIEEWLSDQNGRLLTITGLGGIGKTRLALQAAAGQIGRFRDGVWLVPLAGLSAPTLVISAIGEGLGYTFSGRNNPQQQLIDYLRQKELLLVLDNFEHLLDAADFLVDLLPQAPHLRVLATSRERLDLQAEWLLALDGLPYPDPALATEIDAFGAVQLFIQGMRRVQTGFSLTPENGPVIATICHEVSGVPLGIELAATLSRNLSLAAIASAIQQDTDALAVHLRDLPARHRSVRAVFVSSWQLLTPDLQSVLAQLAVFRGDFSATAATAVTVAPITALNTLVAKSLLRQITADRYELHDLLRQFVGATWSEISQQQPDLWPQVAERHSQTYLQMLAASKADLASGADPLTVPAVQREMANIRQAWGWAVAQPRPDLIQLGAPGLALFHLRTGLTQEGLGLLDMAVTALSSAPEHNQTLAVLHVEQSRLYNFQSNAVETERLARLALAMAGQAITPRLAAEAYLLLGLGHWLQGHYQEASQAAEKGLDLAQQSQHRPTEAELLRLMGMICEVRGEQRDDGLPYYQQALAVLEQTTHPMSQSRLFISLGVLASARARYEEAREYFRQALQLKRHIGSHLGEAVILNNIGVVEERMGNFEAGRDCYLHSLQIRQDLGARQSLSTVLNNLGFSAYSRGHFVEELRYYQQARELATEVGDRKIVGLALTNEAATLIMLGRLAEAQVLVETAVSLAREIERPDDLSLALGAQSFLCLRTGETVAAIAAGEAALAAATQGNDMEYISQAKVGLAWALEADRQWAAAQVLYQTDIDLRTEQGRGETAVFSPARLAQIYLHQANMAPALSCAESVWHYYEKRQLGGVDDPADVCRIVAAVFAAQGDSRAKQMWQRGVDWLQREAAAIAAPDQRRQFLTNVPSHQALLIGWEKSAS